MRKNRSRGARGFTLLEVLIAVLLVAIIATAVVPAANDYAARAREAREEASLREIDLAAQRYELVHKEPLGYCVDTTTDTLYDIAGEDGAGFFVQLLNPTDVNGNVLGASLDPSASSFVHGPYLASSSAPASLLLAGVRGFGTIGQQFGLSREPLRFRSGRRVDGTGSVTADVRAGLATAFALTSDMTVSAIVEKIEAAMTASDKTHAVLGGGLVESVRPDGTTRYAAEGRGYFTVIRLSDLLAFKDPLTAEGDGKWQAAEGQKAARLARVARWISNRITAAVRGGMLHGRWADDYGDSAPGYWHSKTAELPEWVSWIRPEEES